MDGDVSLFSGSSFDGLSHVSDGLTDGKDSESSSVAGAGDQLTGAGGLSTDQFAVVEARLDDIANLNASQLYVLNTGFVVLAATLVFIVFFCLLRTSLGR